MRQQQFRWFLVALSLSNLLFFNVWSNALSGEGDYYRSGPPTNELVSAMLNVGIVAILFFLAADLANRKGGLFSRPLYWLFLGAVLMAAGVPHWIALFVSAGEVVLALLVGAAAAAFLCVSLVWKDKVRRFCSALLLIGVPFVLVTYGRAVWKIACADSNFGSEGYAAMYKSNPSLRVLWVIFDEWDYRLSFPERPFDLDFQNVDRLANDSLKAEEAFPPSNVTMNIVPALLTGKVVKSATPVGARELQLEFTDGKKSSLTDQISIFGEARRLGLNTAAVAWEHPICRLFKRDLNACNFSELTTVRSHESIFSALRAQLTTTFVHGERAEDFRRRHLRIYERNRAAGLAFASDPRYGFVVIHMSVPHQPSIYDRKRTRFTTDGTTSYVDNLALVDDMLASLRREMEANGTWERTVVFAMGDHGWHPLWWRHVWTNEDARFGEKYDVRTPVLVRFPGEGQACSYAKSFNTVLLHDLTVAVLNRQVSNSGEASRWLDVNRMRRDAGRAPVGMY